MSVEEALEVLLRDSGYTFRRVDSAAYAIVRAPAFQPESKPAAPPADIIVTASMRPLALDSAPSSITSLSQSDIERAGLHGASDVALNTAGMIVTNLGPGRNKIFLRGLSDGAFSGRTQSTIGIYLDDVRLTYGAPDPDLRLADIATVEVLRGPQGVRYGAGSIGGIYRIVSNKPDRDQYSASMSATALSVDDGGKAGAYEAMANVPLLSGRGALRAVFYRDVAPGWLDNPGLGLTNSNRTRRQGGRLSSNMQLSDNWTLGFEGVSQGINSRDSQYVDASNTEQIRTARIREPHDNDFAIASVTLKGALSFAELSSTSSFAVHEIASLYDASGALTALGAPANDKARLAMNNKLKFFTEELKLRSAAARFPWALGVFASHGEANEKDSAEDLIGETTIVYDHRRHDDVREFAIFGEATYPLTRSLNVTVGARWFSTSLNMHSETERAVLGSSDAFSGKRRQSDLAPKLEVSYQPAPDLFYYAQIAEGYRTGGFNSGGAKASLFSGVAQPNRRYDADELWNFEAGFKRRLWAGRANIRAAAYGETWKGVQSDQLLIDGLPFTGNVGDARIFGAEAEGAIQLTRRWRSQFSISLSETEINRPDPTFPISSEAGLPGAPKFSAGAAILYDRPLSGGLKLSLDLRGQYIGSSDIKFANEGSTNVGGYTLASTRVGVSGGDWSLTAFVDNLLDEHGATFSYGNPLRFGAEALVTPLMPRSFGVTISKSIGFDAEK